jgi:hypothetical protein
VIGSPIFGEMKGGTPLVGTLRIVYYNLPSFGRYIWMSQGDFQIMLPLANKIMMVKEAK